MSKKDAENNGCSIIQRQFNHEDRAIVDENDGGKLILYVDKDNYIRGGTMIAKNAGEISQELTLAMSEGIKLSALFNKVYPYPTASRINKQIAGDYVSSKLTTKIIWLFQILYKIV